MTIAAMVTVAESHIGYQEGTTTPYGRWYDQVTNQKGFASAPWCDMFLAYCADLVGELSAVGLFAYTPNHVAWFKSRKQWHDGVTGIKRGDIVFFNWDGGEVDHVGLVTSVNGSQIHTVEGNTSDMVAARIRTSGIAGYGRPSYGSVSSPSPKPEPVPSVPKPNPPLELDGDPGKLTWKALQRVLNYRDGSGLAVDGDPGPKTYKALQRALNRGKL